MLEHDLPSSENSRMTSSSRPSIPHRSKSDYSRMTNDLNLRHNTSMRPKVAYVDIIHYCPESGTEQRIRVPESFDPFDDDDDLDFVDDEIDFQGEPPSSYLSNQHVFSTSTNQTLNKTIIPGQDTHDSSKIETPTIDKVASFHISQDPGTQPSSDNTSRSQIGIMLSKSHQKNIWGKNHGSMKTKYNKHHSFFELDPEDALYTIDSDEEPISDDESKDKIQVEEDRGRGRGKRR